MVADCPSCSEVFFSLDNSCKKKENFAQELFYNI